MGCATAADWFTSVFIDCRLRSRMVTFIDSFELAGLDLVAAGAGRSLPGSGTSGPKVGGVFLRDEVAI